MANVRTNTAVRAAGLEHEARHAQAIKAVPAALRTFRQTCHHSFSDDERVEDALEREMKLAYDAVVLNQNVLLGARQTYAFVDDASAAKAYDAEHLGPHRSG